LAYSPAVAATCVHDPLRFLLIVFPE